MARPPYCLPVPSPAGFILPILLRYLLLDFPCATTATPFSQVSLVWVGSFEKSAQRNLLCLRWWTADQRRRIAVDWQVFDSIEPFAGSFRFLEFASWNFYQVFAVIPRRVHTDGAGKGPRPSFKSKASEFPMAQEKSVGVPCDQFSLWCQVRTFHVTEFRPGSFPTPTQLQLSIFSPVVGSPIFPIHSLESANSTILCRVRPPNCKTFHEMDRKRNSW